MKLYLYSNGIVDIATRDILLLEEFISENGYPTSELAQQEFDNRVDKYDSQYYNDLPSEYIILELVANQEFITKRGFTLKTKNPYRETYIKDNIELVLDWRTEMYINLSLDIGKISYEHSQFRITYIDCKELDEFLSFVERKK